MFNQIAIQQFQHRRTAKCTDSGRTGSQKELHTHSDGVGAQQGGVPPQQIQLRRQQGFPVYYTETDNTVKTENTTTSKSEFTEPVNNTPV